MSGGKFGRKGIIMLIVQQLKTGFSALEKAFERFALGKTSGGVQAGCQAFPAELYQRPAAWRRKHRYLRTSSQA